MRIPHPKILKFRGWIGFSVSLKFEKSDGSGGDAQETQGRWSETWGLQF
jgi:hypothetical protein